jgi:hypothetical protein
MKQRESRNSLYRSTVELKATQNDIKPKDDKNRFLEKKTLFFKRPYKIKVSADPQ